ncbi:hypothetical protein QJU23_01785 [Pasteurella atlantica]|uniref:Uncharacterized protein n=2 Tax=Pasteurellaceae TaxID=712 RepID=A0ACC6HJV4_9PAST|nr:hypothetical protein [Pasteurella atlantica]
MTKTLEEILGFDPLTYVNEIPGKIKCDFREFWYVEDNEGIFQKKLFSKLGCVELLSIKNKQRKNLL